MRSFHFLFSHAIRWFLFVITIYALGVLATALYSDEIRKNLLAVPTHLIYTFLSLMALSLGARSIRWLLLNRQMDINLSWFNALKIYWGGFPMVLTPGRIGEVWRPWVLKNNWNISYQRSLPLAFCDRLLDLKVLLIFSFLGIFFHSIFWVPAIIAALVFITLSLFLWQPHRARQIVKNIWKISNKSGTKLFAYLLTFIRYTHRLAHPQFFWGVFILSLFAWSLEAFAITTLAQGMDGKLIFAQALSILGLGNIIGVLTLLPGGVGAQEISMISLLQIFENPLTIAIVIVGIARTGSLLFATFLGLPFFITLSIKGKTS